MGNDVRPAQPRTESFWEAGRFRGTDDVVEFVVQVLEGEISDGFLAIGVDPDLGLVGVGAHRECAGLDELDAEILGMLADELGASALILVFLRGNVDEPDRSEAQRLVALRDECERQGTGLADGVVISGKGFWALRGLAAMS